MNKVLHSKENSHNFSVGGDLACEVGWFLPQSAHLLKKIIFKDALNWEAQN